MMIINDDNDHGNDCDNDGNDCDEDGDDDDVTYCKLHSYLIMLIYHCVTCLNNDF